MLLRKPEFPPPPLFARRPRRALLLAAILAGPTAACTGDALPLGKLTQALGITRDLDRIPMRESSVVVGRTSKRPAPEILVTPRIGITKARDWPLRFLLKNPPSD